jgi:flagellar biogenesis protein FliO
MIGYLLLWLSLAGPQIVQFNALVFFIAFVVIIVYCFKTLGRGLFPERSNFDEGDCGD